MNTLEDLIENGFSEHTAQSMIDAYIKRIGSMSGVYEITDITYNHENRSRIVELTCKGCGKKIYREMIKDRNKWGELIKRCACATERRKDEKRGRREEELNSRKESMNTTAKNIC